MSSAVRLYRPCNGSEGDWFRSEFCDRCKHDKKWREKGENGCEILVASMVFSTDDPGYPREWRYDAMDRPTCTAFLDEDEGDDDSSPRPKPADPLQLTLITDPREDLALFPTETLEPVAT